MFDSLLIANRGEIACRVIRTARRLGIRTIAVYSEADADAMHVAMADEARLIGPAPVSESYLDVDRVVSAARESGASAVHPGYGFLSENPGFAEACEKAGIVFVGPTSDAMRKMAAKDTGKRLMEEAGVPVVPGYHGSEQNAALLAEKASEIGYPVLIKAVSGGGGRGMRRVDAPGDFEAALDGARREAKGAFGDDRVLIERYLTKPRHIEIQVFADAHGNTVHLFERDCSLQRRHQKVVEESPAPGMPATMRDAMGEAAVRAASAIGYRGAGTVEFIADAQGGLREDAFYFIEMNTRLQVEHPVTEMITGRDLVEWQLRVAAGETLPAGQDAISMSGHAIEVRLYAENPNRNFLPSTGTLHRLRFPEQNAHVRIDTGVAEGDDVSQFYDPMIAKLIVWDADRRAALRRLSGALAECQIAGVVSNVPFLSEVAIHPAFTAGDVDTGFIDAHLDALVPDETAPPREALALASLFLLARRRHEARDRADASADPYSPWHAVDGWRMNGEGSEQLRFAPPGGDEIVVPVLHKRTHMVLGLPDGLVEASADLGADGTLMAVVDGTRLSAGILQLGRTVTVMHSGRVHQLEIHDPLDVGDLEEAAGSDVTAPMPGKLVSVLVEPGAKVRKGAALAVLEAMKMEHTLTAPKDGLVEEIRFAAGDQVDEGAIVVTFAD